MLQSVQLPQNLDYALSFILKKKSMISKYLKPISWEEAHGIHLQTKVAGIVLHRCGQHIPSVSSVPALKPPTKSVFL